MNERGDWGERLRCVMEYVLRIMYFFLCSMADRSGGLEPAFPSDFGARRAPQISPPAPVTGTPSLLVCLQSFSPCENCDPHVYSEKKSNCHLSVTNGRSSFFQAAASFALSHQQSPHTSAKGPCLFILGGQGPVLELLPPLPSLGLEISAVVDGFLQGFSRGSCWDSLLYHALL